MTGTAAGFRLRSLVTDVKPAVISDAVVACCVVSVVGLGGCVQLTIFASRSWHEALRVRRSSAFNAKRQIVTRPYGTVCTMQHVTDLEKRSKHTRTHASTRSL